MTNPELKPCPFCGAEEIDIDSEILSPEEGHKEVFRADCLHCDSTGPWGFSKEKAAELWNSRTPSRAALQGAAKDEGGPAPSPMGVDLQQYAASLAGAVEFCDRMQIEHGKESTNAGIAFEHARKVAKKVRSILASLPTETPAPAPRGEGEALREAVLQAIDDEPEFPGEPPPEMLDALQNRDAAVHGLRHQIRRLLKYAHALKGFSESQAELIEGTHGGNY